MAVITLREFDGEIPRNPDYLIPDAAATETEACHLIGRQLEAFKQPLRVTASAVTDTQALYTEDGLNFYVWGQETWPVKSPVVGDIFNRVYWIDKTQSPSAFTVSVAADQQSGVLVQVPRGQIAGVPQPTVAPVLALVDYPTDLPDYPGGSWEFSAWYESNGKQYNRIDIKNAVENVKWKKWSFGVGQVPTTGNPDDVRLVAEIRFMQGTKQITRASAGVSDNPSRMSAFPGGVEMTFRLDEAKTTGIIELTWGFVETRAYVFTVVNNLDEESAPSPATLTSIAYHQFVQISATRPDPTGYRAYNTTNSTNIYRTFGSNSSYLQINATVVTPGTPTSVYSDTSTSTAGAVPNKLLIQQLWQPAPRGLVGQVMMPNGWIAAFKDNTLWMSEPYRPHAWPYSMSFPRNLTGICVGAQGLVVTAVDGCYIVNGVHPANVTQFKVPIPQPGISQRGMCAIGPGVAYISRDGIVLVQGSQASLEPFNQYFDRTSWKTRYGPYLSTMSLAFHDGGLMGFTFTNAPSGGPVAGFWVGTDFTDPGSAYTGFTLRGRAFVYVQQQDLLYFADRNNTGGSDIYTFAEGAPLGCTWRSKDFIYPDFQGFGAGWIRMTGSNPSVNLEFFVDGVQVLMPPDNAKLLTMRGTGYFRLPAGNFGPRWAVRLTCSGDTAVQELYVATDFSEMKGA